MSPTVGLICASAILSQATAAASFGAQAHTYTDNARVLGADGTPIGGLYAAGEAAGFGGGGMHGYRSLEGTFLGGCLFSGRNAGRAAAKGR